MENYKCNYDINFDNGDVQIKLDGDDQVIHFKFAIGFFSIPFFFAILLQLWSGQTKKVELDGFGISVRYRCSVVNDNLLINYRYYEKGAYCTSKYKFNLKHFVEAIDKGFSDYLKEQHSKGILPLKVEEYSHPLSRKVIEEYNQFSTAIRKT